MLGLNSPLKHYQITKNESDENVTVRKEEPLQHVTKSKKVKQNNHLSDTYLLTF